MKNSFFLRKNVLPFIQFSPNCVWKSIVVLEIIRCHCRISLSPGVSGRGGVSTLPPYQLSLPSPINDFHFTCFTVPCCSSCRNQDAIQDRASTVSHWVPLPTRDDALDDASITNNSMYHDACLLLELDFKQACSILESNEWPMIYSISWWRYFW